MDIPKFAMEEPESIPNVTLNEELSIEKITAFEKEIEVTSRKYIKDFEDQMKRHQRAIEEINAATKQFIEGATNTLNDSNGR